MKVQFRNENPINGTLLTRRSFVSTSIRTHRRKHMHTRRAAFGYRDEWKSVERFQSDSNRSTEILIEQIRQIGITH